MSPPGAGASPPVRYNAPVPPEAEAAIFLISPARCSGDRAARLVSSKRSALGQQLRAEAATIGEVFAWLSALYFRGKLTYARRFAAPGGVHIMAPGLGLRPPELLLSRKYQTPVAGSTTPTLSLPSPSQSPTTGTQPPSP